METTLGERFKQIRKKLGMTQKEFAESLGVTQTTISGIEKNTANTSLTLAKLISIKYNITEEWIIDGIGQMEYYPSEWSDEDISGLLQKIDAMKIIFDKNIEHLKSDKEKLFSVVEAFSYFTSLVSTSKLKDADAVAYLNLIYDLFDKLEKYIFQCSLIKNRSNTDFEQLYYLKLKEDKLQSAITQIIRNISSIYIEQR